MNTLDQKILDIMILPKNIDERSINITTLKENDQFSLLEPTEDENILFQRADTMPRYLEKYLIVDFDRKRSMITEILFDIHKYYPEIFSLAAYSDIAKRVFSVVTRYRWSGEDAGIVVRLISMHIQPYLRKLPESFILSTFQKHDATFFFDTEEIGKIIHSCSNEYDMPLHRKRTVHRMMNDSIEDVRYLQKVFRKNFSYFSELFGTSTLEGFLSEDTDAIVHHEKMTRTYIEIFQQILMSKIDALNITSERKIAYKTSVSQGSNLRAILLWSDLLLKRG